MISQKKTKIIFFIAGAAPTQDEVAMSESYIKARTRVVLRNATLIVPGEALEQCDAVAGTVPALYNEFPRAENAEQAKENFEAGKGYGLDNAPLPPGAPQSAIDGYEEGLREFRARPPVATLVPPESPTVIEEAIGGDASSLPPVETPAQEAEAPAPEPVPEPKAVVAPKANLPKAKKPKSFHE